MSPRTVYSRGEPGFRVEDDTVNLPHPQLVEKAVLRPLVRSPTVCFVLYWSWFCRSNGEPEFDCLDGSGLNGLAQKFVTIALRLRAPDSQPLHRPRRSRMWLSKIWMAILVGCARVVSSRFVFRVRFRPLYWAGLRRDRAHTGIRRISDGEPAVQRKVKGYCLDMGEVLFGDRQRVTYSQRGWQYLP